VERTFVDEVELFLKAGRGGDGLLVSHRLPSGRFLNNGGSGGKGGDIYICVDKSLTDLSSLLHRRNLKAESGGSGRRSNKTGAGGKDLVIKVPLGTQIREKGGKLLADLLKEGQAFLAAKGGRGGLGNFRKRVNDYLRQRSRGEAGEEKCLILDYRIPAEIALVGFTNTGKSTFLSRLTSLKPKISPYPFTTKHPLWGVGKIGFSNFRVLELPAIGDNRFKNKIEREFLKHLERVKIIILFQDTSCGSLENFFLLNKLISSYNSRYLNKRIIKVVNKIDVGFKKDEEAIGLSLHHNRGWERIMREIKEVLALNSEF